MGLSSSRLLTFVTATLSRANTTGGVDSSSVAEPDADALAVVPALGLPEQPSPHARVVKAHAFRFGRASDHAVNFLGAVRGLEVVMRTSAHGRDRRVDRGVARKDDALRGEWILARPAQHFEAVDVRQTEPEERNIEGELLDGPECIAAIRETLHAVPLILEGALEHAGDGIVVFGNQDADVNCRKH